MYFITYYNGSYGNILMDYISVCSTIHSECILCREGECRECTPGFMVTDSGVCAG